jgi:hypothetical protein
LSAPSIAARVDQARVSQARQDAEAFPARARSAGYSDAQAFRASERNDGGTLSFVSFFDVHQRKLPALQGRNQRFGERIYISLRICRNTRIGTLRFVHPTFLKQLVK